jgi:hypothetical protein
VPVPHDVPTEGGVLKGRAYQLLVQFRAECAGPEGVFRMSRLILLSRIVPERITPDFDDEEVEARIERAILRMARKQDRAS